MDKYVYTKIIRLQISLIYPFSNIFFKNEIDDFLILPGVVKNHKNPESTLVELVLAI